MNRLRLIHALKDEAVPSGSTALPHDRGCGSRFSQTVSRALGDQGIPGRLRTSPPPSPPTERAEPSSIS